MKYNGPKVRLSRRIGVAITPRAQRRLERDLSSPNGMRPRRLSEYGLQLLEKQRLRFQYNVSERQLRRYFAQAQRTSGATGANLVTLLERRLDAFILRSGLAPTLYAARQLVGHGHFEVNGIRVNCASQLLRPGDRVHVRERSRTSPVFDMDWSAYVAPTYIERDTQKLTASLTRLPDREEIPITCADQRVVEYYSR